MGNIMINWKTAAAGIAAILGALASVVNMLAIGHWDGTQLMADWTAVTAGLGLVFAKDGNVTGGTVAATSEAATRVAKP